MNKLIIDSSSNLLYIGLVIDDKTFELTRVGKNDNAAYVVDLIDQILTSNNLKLNNINTIVVGVGPGSYTGARVAVVVAKTLAYSANIKLEGISSLNLLSSGYEGLVNVVIDARRNHYFMGSYNNGIALNKDTYIEILNINETNNIILDIDTIKVDLIKVINNSYPIDNIHDLEPNYLRKTEAETNLDAKNGN